jgi:hypothetical protein
MGSVENWRELLLPLLEMKLSEQGPRAVARKKSKRTLD